MLETLDYTIRIGSTTTILYFDFYLYSAYEHTTFISTMYTAYLKHILWLNVCERTVLIVLKSILSNIFHRGEDVKIRIFPSSARRQPSRRW